MRASSIRIGITRADRLSASSSSTRFQSPGSSRRRAPVSSRAVAQLGPIRARTMTFPVRLSSKPHRCCVVCSTSSNTVLSQSAGKAPGTFCVPGAVADENAHFRPQLLVGCPFAVALSRGWESQPGTRLQSKEGAIDDSEPLDFSIPNLMGDCKGSAGAIGSRSAAVKPQIDLPESGCASGKGGAPGIDSARPGFRPPCTGLSPPGWTAWSPP
jgi:hypothetical protein